MTSTAQRVKDLSDRIAAARKLTVLTGAGVSAASGVPTFRGPGGLWRNFRPEQLATPEAFRRDPRLVWEWYDWRRQVIASCEPNAAHHVIARWSAAPGFTLVTQNVDGLHERAGTRNVIRYHGSIWRLRCAAECTVQEAAEYAEHADQKAAECAEYADQKAAECAEHADQKAAEYPEHTDQKAAEYAEYAEWEDLTVPLDPLPPRCAACGGLARPAVVWFGESIPAAAARAALDATACDVFLSIGTSSVVYPAAGLIAEARARGAYTVEINPDATGAPVHLAIPMAAEDVLQQLPS